MSSETEQELRLVELLCSRLCHDLVSPIGAIHNGLELLEENELEMEKEILGLLRKSSIEASCRLRFFRVAFGQASGSTEMLRHGLSNASPASSKKAKTPKTSPGAKRSRKPGAGSEKSYPSATTCHRPAAPRNRCLFFADRSTPRMPAVYTGSRTSTKTSGFAPPPPRKPFSC